MNLECVLWDVSRWLTVLDIIVADSSIPPTASFPQHSVEGAFISKNFDILTEDAGSRGLKLDVMVEEERLIVRLVPQQKDCPPLTKDDVRAMIATEEEKLSVGRIDTVKVVKDTVAACIDILCQRSILSDSTKEHLRKVVPQVIEPVGLVEYEVTCSAGGATILFPDANIFQVEHWDLACRGYPDGQRRRYLDQAVSLVLWMPHEVTHCLVDGILGSTGAGASTVETNWRMEYIACWHQYTLMAAVVREMRRRAQSQSSPFARPVSWPNAALEQSCIWLQRIISFLAPQYPKEYAAAQEWVASSGVTTPIPDVQPNDYMQENKSQYLLMLAVVAVAAFEAVRTAVEGSDSQMTYLTALDTKLAVLASISSEAAVPKSIPLVVEKHSEDFDGVEETATLPGGLSAALLQAQFAEIGLPLRPST